MLRRCTNVAHTDIASPVSRLLTWVAYVTCRLNINHPALDMLSAVAVAGDAQCCKVFK